MSGTLNWEVLVVARESRGMSQAGLAEKAQTNQALISKAENGVAELPEDVLRRVAGILEYPVELFYEWGRVREEGSACLYHRKRKTLPATILKRLDGRMFIRNINLRRLLGDLDIEGDRIFHTLDPDEFNGSAAEVARALRSMWRIPPGPIQNLTALIESAGGVVLFAGFGTRKLFGMSCWTTRSNPLFFLNGDIPMADLRWTMAHELGHLTMHRLAPDVDPETQADAFAAEFLAPAAQISADLFDLRFDRLGPLKGFWRLPMKAIIKRAMDLGRIDSAASVRLYKQFSARGYNTHEPYEVPSERPALAKAAIDVHLGEHEYSVGELAKAIRLEPQDFEILMQEAGAEMPRQLRLVSL